MIMKKVLFNVKALMSKLRNYEFFTWLSSCCIFTVFHYRAQKKNLNPSSTPYFSKIIQPVNELYMLVLRYIIHIHMCEISARLLYIF